VARALLRRDGGSGSYIDYEAINKTLLAIKN